MEERKSVFEYIKELFTCYGIVILIFIAINYFIGDQAGSVSTLFALGSKGLSSAMLLQLFLMGVITTIAQNIFLTDLLIKNMSLIVRHILFFMTLMVAIIIFAVCFGWFPLNDPAAWVGFIVSFSVCSVMSAFIMRLEEKAENKKMQEALNRLKK